MKNREKEQRGKNEDEMTGKRFDLSDAVEMKPSLYLAGSLSDRKIPLS
jgi:hypothetical protein